MRTLCRIHECELSALGGKLLAPHEQASFAEGSLCAPFVRDVRTLDDNGVSLDKGDGTEQEVDSPAADATGLGVTVMQQAHVHCVNTSFVDLGIGVALRQNGSAVVVRCTFRELNLAAFSAQEHEDSDDADVWNEQWSEPEGALCIVNSRVIGGLTWLSGCLNP